MNLKAVRTFLFWRAWNLKSINYFVALGEKLLKFVGRSRPIQNFLIRKNWDFDGVYVKIIKKFDRTVGKGYFKYAPKNSLARLLTLPHHHHRMREQFQVPRFSALRKNAIKLMITVKKFWLKCFDRPNYNFIKHLPWDRYRISITGPEVPGTYRGRNSGFLIKILTFFLHLFTCICIWPS